MRTVFHRWRNLLRGLAVIIWLLPRSVWSADPVCEFEDPSHRLISGTNPADLKCIRARAEAGDEFQQYYLGLILVGQVSGPKNVPEGLAVLKKLASFGKKYNGDAMRFIGYVYLDPDSSLKHYELAYQWLYLASNTPRFKDSNVLLPNEVLNAAISPQRMQELERSAAELLRVQ